jgi:hypothetical protein
MLQRIAYYEGEQRLANLGCRSRSSWRTCGRSWTGRGCASTRWSSAPTVDGFRLPGATDIDSELQQHWQANDLDAEFPLPSSTR